MQTTGISLVIMIMVCSCAQQNKLTGNWEYDHTRKTVDAYPDYDILIFLNDSIVDTKRNHKATRYRFKNDSLFIYELNEEQWRGPYVVAGHTKDSLVLRSLSEEHVYKRFQFPADKAHQLDQIVLSTSGCFGRCPIINISISSNGDVVYYGERFADNIGYYTAKLPAGMFEEIEKHFGWANYDTLSQYYTNRVTDSETISTTFLKGDGIINSVQDYAHSSGNRYLNWAYPDLVYLSEQLHLVPLDSAKIPFHYSLGSMQFSKGKESWRLKKSEAFLLWNYLRAADTVNASLGPESYDLKYWSDKGEGTIKTDGRLYRVPNGLVLVTLDIGFDFLTRNPQIVHFAKGEE